MLHLIDPFSIVVVGSVMIWEGFFCWFSTNTKAVWVKNTHLLRNTWYYKWRFSPTKCLNTLEYTALVEKVPFSLYNNVIYLVLHIREQLFRLKILNLYFLWRQTTEIHSPILKTMFYKKRILLQWLKGRKNKIVTWQKIWINKDILQASEHYIEFN